MRVMSDCKQPLSTRAWRLSGEMKPMLPTIMHNSSMTSNTCPFKISNKLFCATYLQSNKYVLVRPVGACQSARLVPAPREGDSSTAGWQ